MDYKLLVIGKLPPPIGGVTIHIKRFLELLTVNEIKYRFLDLRRFSFWKMLREIARAKLVHIHVSNVEFQFFLVILCRLFMKRSIVTFHGDLFRFNGFKKNITFLSIRYCNAPILLNEKSYLYSKKINVNSSLLTAFIPPINQEEPLESPTIDKIIGFKKKFKKLFATNGSAVNYDNNKSEIYGILDLVDFFKMHTDGSIGLIISDPSGAYEEYFNLNGIPLPSNILMLSSPHSYFEIIRIVDATIRNTSTDGDSLSVRESLFLNKATFATNIIERPKGTILYKRGEYYVFLEDWLQQNEGDFDSIELLVQYFHKLYNKLI